ncbi:hypothetical protein Tco_1197509 [Tanacetum coccineum]
MLEAVTCQENNTQISESLAPSDKIDDIDMRKVPGFEQQSLKEDLCLKCRNVVQLADRVRPVWSVLLILGRYGYCFLHVSSTPIMSEVGEDGLSLEWKGLE